MTPDLATEIAGISHPLVVAIDAPLIVTPHRWVERDVGRRFGRFKASAHSASLELLRRTGRTAGMDLGKALQQHGITLDPSDLLRGERCVRTAVEVYPHVIHVCLLGLTEGLPYKAKTGRSVAFRRAILCEYQDHLRSLLRRYASGLIRNPELQLALSHETVMAAKGVVLKRFEDKLDAVTCALAAWMIWHDPSRWEKLGDLNGYIVAPLGEN